MLEGVTPRALHWRSGNDELRELLEEVDRPRGCLTLPDSVSVLVLVLCVGLESGGDELLSLCDSSLDGESERLLCPCDSSSLDGKSEQLLSPCDSSLDGDSEWFAEEEP